MAKNRTMAVKNAKAKKMAMAESKLSVCRKFRAEYVLCDEVDRVLRNSMYKPDYSSNRIRKIPILSYKGRYVAPNNIKERCQ